MKTTKEPPQTGTPETEIAPAPADGLTVRDRFAIAALPAIIATAGARLGDVAVAARAYAIADKMMIIKNDHDNPPFESVGS